MMDRVGWGKMENMIKMAEENSKVVEKKTCYAIRRQKL